ncbi:Polysaccharide pyruvyl transferase family protein WcaK [Colwellia chukchiensis]|uniref:Polysaccharide pyruvyl transferase family protein WcaK n=1 Tax=Colwellia chukchiensis TaxID=641665 RepID=A0A1H7H8T9_9GAMM|nr:polysaccharide pyruvyl transferase family protein [Colwellia chukchiensis]SEK46691.1 Polysaccharide pyruvyl transferase family protein WcaK [Colwellia chukchiensis]
MIIELKGVEFENKGAELMLHGILQRIEQYWPDAEIALTPGAKAPYKLRASLGAWQKLSLRKSYLDVNFLAKFLPNILTAKLKGFGIVTEADIDVIIDASGFSYSDQWGSDLRVRHAAAEASRLKAKGGAYIFMPQAMGPFNQDSTQKLIKNGFPNAALVCARDKDTYNHLFQASGGFSSLRQYKDFTNAVTGIVPEYFVDGDKKLCIIPNKNMVNPRNKHSQWLDSYIDTLVSFAHLAVEKKLTPFLLNHEGDEDGEVIAKIIEKFGQPLEVIKEENPLMVKGIIQASKVAVCSRYHGCISALSAGKSCIGTSWSHKYERLYEEYNAEALLIKPKMTHEALSEVLSLALDTESEVAKEVAKKASVFKQETEQLWQDVKAIVDSIAQAKK